jgi:hypothetical protein
MKKLILSFASLALIVASAGTHKLTLHQPSLINGKELKAGEYKIEVKDSIAVIRNGKSSVEAPVKIETAGDKFNATSVRYQNGDGKYRIQEIRLGGTNTKLVFD